jgi:PAS domain S-box-containing protein
MTDNNDAKQVEQLLEIPNLADALESDRFKQFLDHIPFAVAVSELRPTERIIYANLEFERLTGQAAANLHGKPWSALLKSVTAMDDGRELSDAITDDDDYIGEFTIQHGDETICVDAWSNAIQDDDGSVRFRLLALADISH